MWFQYVTWGQASKQRLFDDEPEEPQAG